jgi:hypothetical protein
MPKSGKFVIKKAPTAGNNLLRDHLQVTTIHHLVHY